MQLQANGKQKTAISCPKSERYLTTKDVIAHFKKLAQDYPIQSMEDPLAEEDYDGFAKITQEIGEQVQIVGDDLFVTNPHRLREGIAQGCANAILIKPNQIGTLSETMETVRLAKAYGYGTILSHRSGGDRGYFHSRYRGGAQCRADQNRCACKDGSRL